MMNYRKLHKMSRAQVEAELERRNAAHERNVLLSITGPPRSRFAYASAATRGRTAIRQLEDRLFDLERWPWMDPGAR